jgi:hypothetical protein
MKFLDIVEPLYHFLPATSQLVSLRSISGPVTEDFIFNQFDLNIQYRADYLPHRESPPIAETAGPCRRKTRAV